jgi:hypothetical protein
MNTRRWFLTPLSIATTMFLPSAFLPSAFLLSVAQASTNDREYQMGDDDGPPAISEGSAVSPQKGTFDSQGLTNSNQLHDLIPTGGPVYRTISGRPDGGSGFGIEFSGSSQYLQGARLGLPETTASAIGGDFGGTLNYNGLADRGFQFWVQPTATTAQSLVMDGNQHGARISAGGNFSMQYANADFDSTLAVVPSNWYHVMVVRPDSPTNGARMYIDGVAVAAAPDGYDGADTANLVVGSNTGGDDGFDGGVGFTGGTEEFFSGIIDDLTMFVIGDNTGDPGLPNGPVGQDYGPFDFATDNGFAAFTLSGVAGDVDNNGAFEEADKTAFIAGWMNENLVNGIRVGDLASLGDGDLNFDGITDIRDLVIIQAELPIAGLSTITGAQLVGVPEPATITLLLATAMLAPVTCRRFTRSRCC